ncbi:hypothetical protein QBC33DRAFT_543353 [Phialemonium atrogriseum]|uniref:Secreted protein n=1 Tax=Phialemonium atrogriseum TaxID=1093897 RepID=A0AAJ0FEI2_9PEZI|nr:uncharacterized protein QBC33DRAFT_543353 [Phialemonium atrogriseum]KAK1765611.1 hypothetical protein QBC33DRAFT_543353 [Phialemonium atrogriseum]
MLSVLSVLSMLSALSMLSLLPVLLVLSIPPVPLPVPDLDRLAAPPLAAALVLLDDPRPVPPDAVDETAAVRDAGALRLLPRSTGTNRGRGFLSGSCLRALLSLASRCSCSWCSSCCRRCCRPRWTGAAGGVAPNGLKGPSDSLPAAR